MISRVLCHELNLRAYTVTSLNATRAITSIHSTTPNATVPLARTISAAALMSATLKPQSHQSVALKFSGSGPLREIHVQCDARGHIRGYAGQPLVDTIESFDSLDFSKAIGAGFLTVTKDLGMKEPYTSHIPLLAGDVAKDAAYYLTASEQIPSALILGLACDRDTRIISSGGILIQTFPDTDQSVIQKIEATINSMPAQLGDLMAQGHDILGILSEIFDKNALDITDSYPLRAGCRCSKNILHEVLKTLPQNDLSTMIHEDRGAEITCIFCNRVYHFDEDELRKLLNEKEKKIN